MCTYNQLNTTVKRRMRMYGVCLLCGQKIESDESMEYITYPDGRNKGYAFFHVKCLRSVNLGSTQRGGYNAEE